MYRKKRALKLTATFMLVIMVFQLVYPNRALALTSGPSQPEVQGFEPVGTTDMVDLFSGDFNYNIPLLDVEGYPINIAYHAGINMDQEASWVGLGWNINPGEINRTVRGFPDDFDGDSLKKITHIKDEKNVTIGANLNAEPEGVGPPIANLSLSLGGNINFSNYKGISVNLTGGVNANILKFVSAGLNVGVGSQTGAGIDYNGGVGFSSSSIMNSDVCAGIGVGYNSGYNTRTGLATRSFNVSVSASGYGAKTGLFDASIPIGMVNNIVPVVTNASSLRTFNAQLRVGGEAFGVFGAIGVNARVSILHYDEEGSRKAYGYLNVHNASDNDLLDFTREKDGVFNQSMSYLPLSSLTYDIFSVSGQGTGGSYRPLRNDAGSVFDALTESRTDDKSHSGEAGIGNVFSLGYDRNGSNTTVHSGPWKDRQSPFFGPVKGNVYEHAYFKQGGELTQNGGSGSRTARSNLLYYFNADEATRYGVATDTALYSYNSTNGFNDGYPGSGKKDYISRIDRGGGLLGRKEHQISEMVQVQPNGKRYVYGIPAMNNIQKEVTFAIDHPEGGSDLDKGIVSYERGSDDSRGNQKGIDKFFSATYTPSYAHSYLLNAVLSVDYIDVKGDGPSDDDFGTYTKFNYTRKESDYRWRAPIEEGKAQYAPGFVSDHYDDKASYLIGSREQWMLHSIETKNFVAEFYTSPRLDAKGVKEIVDSDGFNSYPYNTELETAGSSYKLDSIKLFNKGERFTNPAQAIPVKTVYFVYDYSLCPGVPNKDPEAPSDLGKLTLKKLFVKYGNSEKSLISPYQFTYSGFNPGYNLANKDRWGGYKPNTLPLNNIDYPFVDQGSDSLDIYASAWSLENIQLPSGGVINVEYEADDYSHVQNLPAMEMYPLSAVGKTKFFQPGNELFFRKANPNLFAYFRRRPANENYGIPPSARYASKGELIYFNFNISIVPGRYEPVKGYAEVLSANICPNDTNYAYVQFKPAAMNGVGGVHPAAYTSLNVGRYHLPHLVFPGSDPDKSDISNILSGMFDAIKGLVRFMENPLGRLMDGNQGKYIIPEKSFLRLANTNGHKVGGGHRVKSMKFYDNWSTLAGGDAQDATYGKDYDYGTGVASYEPLIGGDENPYRTPMPYKVQDGTNFPPSDPVELFQENPLGENFFPPASVGYSKVIVSSIHRSVGRSAQGQDIYEYYTARDFPVQVSPSSITELKKERKFKFKQQRVVLNVEQEYSIVLNDMHGKMKRVEHRVLLPENKRYRTISYQDYRYNSPGSPVPVLTFNGTDYVPGSKVLGEQSDVTSDSREKIERTVNSAFFFSSNGFMAGPIPIYIPVPVPWDGEYLNEFRCHISTAVTQRYGMLMEVKSFDEGATTTVRNEVFDPNSGQPIITSVNNEFDDREYTMNMPAYWAYGSMGPSYQNIGYTQHFDHLDAIYDADYPGSRFKLTKLGSPFRIGDEVLVRELDSNGKIFTAWVMPIDTNMSSHFFDQHTSPLYHWDMCVGLTIKIRNGQSAYTAGLSGGLNNVDVKVIRSGYKNQLNETIETVTALDPVTDGSGKPKSKFTKVINIKAQQFHDSSYARLDRPEKDSVNDFLNGNLGVQRLFKEHIYVTNRNYTGSGVRKAGLYDAPNFWQYLAKSPIACRLIQARDAEVELPRDLYDSSPGYDEYSRLQALGLIDEVKLKYRVNTLIPITTDKNWKLARTITKWTPWGFEAENVDALGNYSAALFRYNQEKPVAVAQNARQKELLNDSFEDYAMLQVFSRWLPFDFSPILSQFGPLVALSGTPYGSPDVVSGSSDIQIVDTIAHSGTHCLLVNASVGSYYSIPASVVDTSSIKYMEHGKLIGDKQYIFSYWFRPQSVSNGTTEYTLPSYSIISSGTTSVVRKSNIIDGWQQVEVRFTAPSAPTSVSINLPGGTFVDDIRLYPADGNMKAFVYNPLTQKLMATLDENNYATFYEYDVEGNLIRTKRETERGIITLSESRSANPLSPLN